jgi:hypothetical protein
LMGTQLCRRLDGMGANGGGRVAVVLGDC